MNAYKTFKSALAAANGSPILRMGNLYIVGVDHTTQVELIGPTGHITGHIGLGHLDRLGNGNWAIEEKQHPNRIYTFESERLKAQAKREKAA